MDDIDLCIISYTSQSDTELLEKIRNTMYKRGDYGLAARLEATIRQNEEKHAEELKLGN